MTIKAVDTDEQDIIRVSGECSSIPWTLLPSSLTGHTHIIAYPSRQLASERFQLQGRLSVLYGTALWRTLLYKIFTGETSTVLTHDQIS